MIEIAVASIIIIMIIILLMIYSINKKIISFNQAEIKTEFERIDRAFRDELFRNREEISKSLKSQREELSNSINNFGELLSNRLYEIAKMQKAQLDIFADQLLKLTQSNEQKFDKLQMRVEDQLKEIQENNSKKLEEMRQTVDEKLHATLEKRLGESFKLVSERLEQVYKGLGDMQELARGVGDLKNVLTNVKTRGTWGEIQLENLIEQILTREQYEKNVITKKGSNEKVEVAIKLPGRDSLKTETVWLPIDAKFPIEDYQRLLDAQDAANIDAINDAAKGIEARIKSEAKKIAEKYLDPPNTTDFAIMFLPIEGLYAEVLRRPGLAEFIQREYRVTIAGPTNLAAILNSLQMGFRTLAIEKRSSEVWKILSSVKTEFGKFGDVLEATQKKLQEASNKIEEATKSTRKIERQLKDVQVLPPNEQIKLLE
ncbi:MAG: DNA recombination protein RmuC [Melioribacter sp.]|uniref:DNA recombination protein RmuC n=1 Tax=Rosettibacter primus TaxID=3111523 RepID=UPI00247DF2A5|nr:DNA recombination protein RmuC [Melioribacter sp.]